MKTFSRFCACACLLAWNALPLPAQQPGKAGEFDYYLFVLSWSPEFCHSHPDDPQCSQHLGFVIHGFWPQYNSGSYPVDCPTGQPAPSDTAPVSGIMPSEIIPHEWQKHGTCTGLSGNDYLALIRRVFDSIAIPARLKAPSQPFTERGSELKQEFEQANPSLHDADIAIELSHGYLSAVEFCFSRTPTPAPIACSNVRDAGGGTFRIAPVR